MAAPVIVGKPVPASPQRQAARSKVASFCRSLFPTSTTEDVARGFTWKANRCTLAFFHSKNVDELMRGLLCIDLAGRESDYVSCVEVVKDQTFQDAVKPGSTLRKAFMGDVEPSMNLITKNLDPIGQLLNLVSGTAEGTPIEAPAVTGPSGPVLRVAIPPPPGPAPPPSYIAPPPPPPPIRSAEERVRAGMKESRLSPLEQKTFLDALTACLQSYTPRTAQVVDAIIPAAGAVERRMSGMGELDKLDELCHQIRDSAVLAGPELGESLRGLAECLVCKDRGPTLMAVLTEQLKAVA